MNALRFLIVLASISTILLLQACGTGGGSTDTAGALTISKPAAADNGNGQSTVTFSVTYSPPSGKTAQGVVVVINITGFATDRVTLTSGSNSASYTAIVDNGTTISISAAVNTMTAGTVFFVPTGATPGTGALTVAPTTADFIFTDPALSIKTITISGGTAPYFVASSVPADIGAIMATGTTATVTLVNAAAPPSPGIQSNATVTITDSATPTATKTVAITYFK